VGAQAVFNLIFFTNKEIWHFYTLNVKEKFMLLLINKKAFNKTK
jgi:hypothetical protein